jgi:hypothetical protein
MPQIADRFQFEPDHEARTQWLATRKEHFSCGPNIFPGFYQTTGFVSDTGWVFFAIIIEAAALILALQGGINRGGLYLVGAIIAIILFITLDIVGVILLHSRIGEIQRLSNMLIIADAIQRPGVEAQIREHKSSIKSKFGFIALIFSSLLKIASVLLLTRLNIVFYVVLSVFYILVIYIHSRHTGYCIAEVLTSNAFKKNHNQYTDDLTSLPVPQQIHNKARTLQTIFPTEFELRLPIEAGGHSITLIRTLNENNTIHYEYALTTTGILLDSDFIFMIQNQATNNQRDIVGKKCLEHQLVAIH